MLKADMALSDLSFNVQWKDDAIAFGESRIRPYRHPALETLLISTDGQWFMVVRERLATAIPQETTMIETVDAERFHQLYKACLMWPLDYVMIEVAQAGRRIKVRAGMFGSAPVYCRAESDRLTISWDFADFLAKPSTMNLEIASHYLALGSVYSAQHIYAGVTLLTERALLYVEPGRAHYQYPAAIEAATPSTRLEHGDALAGFGEQLRRAASARPMTAAQITVELSGGMDSATVASTLAALHGPIMSKGILLHGEHRQIQVDRRRLIASRLGLLDETFDIEAFPPSLDLQPGGRTAYAHAELYLEAFESLWHSARAQGGDLLFTGIGGDELFPVYHNEAKQAEGADSSIVTEARRYAEQLLTPRALNAARSLRGLDAPASPVPTSGLLAGVCQAPHLLRHGLWPVNLLSDPRLIAFCHRLPAEDRHSREVMRSYLHANLGDNVFPRNYTKETFARVLPPLIAQQARAIAAQLENCVLADLGLVDQRAVLALLDKVVTTQTDAATAPLVSFLWLERFARQVS